MIEPVQTTLSQVQRNPDQPLVPQLLDSIVKSTGKVFQPFIQESIWIGTVLDIFARKGRTKEGRPIYNPEEKTGNKMFRILDHLIESQMPLNWKQMQRLGLSMFPADSKGRFDERGNEYEFGNEALGVIGFRAQEIDPNKSIKYKIAQYNRDARESKSLFTQEVLKGGVTTPKQIIDAYINANRALFDVKKTLKGDMDAARLLNISEEGFYGSLDRISNVEVSAIDENIFRPYRISKEVRDAFEQNASRIGIANPFDTAADAISELEGRMADLSLTLPEFPVFANPLQPIMQDTPLGPTTLNLPSINNEVVSAQVQGSNYNNLTTQQKLDLLFGRG